MVSGLPRRIAPNIRTRTTYGWPRFSLWGDYFTIEWRTIALFGPAANSDDTKIKRDLNFKKRLLKQAKTVQACNGLALSVMPSRCLSICRLES